MTARELALAKAWMCKASENCVGCPLERAGKELGAVDINGTQNMKWCELFTAICPAQAVDMIEAWWEEHKEEIVLRYLSRSEKNTPLRRWIKNPDISPNYKRCPYCLYEFGRLDPDNFCPNCGEEVEG